LARIGRSFYERPTPQVAREALGNMLVRVVEGRRLSGLIVETEAYRGSRDPASHAYRGKTTRNAVMFGEAGHAYVYFTMGLHHCLNLTTEERGTPGAVLVRAIEPCEGVDEMKKNRGIGDVVGIANGPGKLTEALSINRELNGEDMVTSERLFLEEGERVSNAGTSPRIGISKGVSRRWRFFVRGSKFVSKGRRQRPRIHN
jgi:DNA-3-methyladenine glycosylase